MSNTQPKKMFSDHQVLMGKLNSLEKEHENLTNGVVQQFNQNHGRFAVLEIVLDQLLIGNVEIHEFKEFTEEEFSKTYGFLFKNYFMNLETNEIIQVIFEPIPEDELLDNSK
jgi:hypothetical protein